MLQRRRGLGIGCGGGEVVEGETAGGRTLGCQYRNHKREDADVWKIRPMRGRTRISRCTTTERSSRERKKKTKKKKKKSEGKEKEPTKKKERIACWVGEELYTAFYNTVRQDYWEHVLGWWRA